MAIEVHRPNAKNPDVYKDGEKINCYEGHLSVLSAKTLAIYPPGEWKFARHVDAEN